MHFQVFFCQITLFIANLPKYFQIFTTFNLVFKEESTKRKNKIGKYLHFIGPRLRMFLAPSGVQTPFEATVKAMQ